MVNLLEPNVCEPRPSVEDWTLIAEGAQMTSEVLDMPWLLEYVDHDILGVWYWQNLCMRIGLVTGGVVTQYDYTMIQFGVKMHAVHDMVGVPRMFFTQHTHSDESCYYCATYRSSLFMEFGFELSKFLGYDGVDASVFDYYANDGYDGYDGDDGDDVDGSAFEDYDGNANGNDGDDANDGYANGNDGDDANDGYDGYDGDDVDGSAFEDYDGNANGYDGYDGDDVDGSAFEDYDGNANGNGNDAGYDSYAFASAMIASW